jgi:peptide/nickel transport system permease protein
LLLPLGLFLLVIAAGLLLPLPSASEQSLADRLLEPVFSGGTWNHPLGTDGLGRDVMARITDGAITSLRISAIAATLAALAGVACGMLAGISGGWIDHLLTLLAEVTLTVPTVVVGVVLTATLGQSFQNLIAILVLGGWISYARVLRLETRQLRQSDFILAAAVTGGSRWHIGIRHLLPNLMPTVLVLYAQQLGGMMLWEASLTYLGLGARADLVTLGGIVRDGQAQIFGGWWIGVTSGFMVALAIVGFAFAGDWLRNRFDHGETSGLR